MTIAQITSSMIAYSEGNLHDINHFLKVYSFAKTIGELEDLDTQTQHTLEVAALVHDIACPLCREKYGNTEGKNQERESDALVRTFLGDKGLDDHEIDRIAFLVSHHHTYKDVDGVDYRILLEADYLVNAEESHYSRENIMHAKEAFFRTGSGQALLDTMYLR